ncbi:MAG: hypothetical protein LBH37_02720 [Oscillospiraceae bacterium]|jgi:hypothetical protein|nr:hypothetical protein [Oscillospiraceae bacterium]
MSRLFYRNKCKRTVRAGGTHFSDKLQREQSDSEQNKYKLKVRAGVPIFRTKCKCAVKSKAQVHRWSKFRRAPEQFKNEELKKTKLTICSHVDVFAARVSVPVTNSDGVEGFVLFDLSEELKKTKLTICSHVDVFAARASVPVINNGRRGRRRFCSF